jgi:3-oxoadipate enol-lactonase
MSATKTETILENPAIAIDHAGDGEFLILMHGIGGNRSNWTEQVDAYSPHFHTVSWDARGYGGSDDYDGPLDFADFSHDLARVLDHFEVERAHVLGLSMGGRIAQDFYARYPDRVKTLVLVATFSGFKNFTQAEKQRFVDLRRKPLVEEGKEPRDIAPVVAKTLVGPHATDEQYQRLVASMEKLHKESYIKTVEATTYYDRTLELEKIAVPTLLVYGEHDPLTRPELGEQMAAKIPGCEFVIIPKAGHLINMEQAQAFDTAVLDFLLRHKG